MYYVGASNIIRRQDWPALDKFGSIINYIKSMSYKR